MNQETFGSQRGVHEKLSSQDKQIQTIQKLMFILTLFLPCVKMNEIAVSNKYKGTLQFTHDLQKMD